MGRELQSYHELGLVEFYGRNFCLINELSIIGILNYWAIIAATRGKRAAPTTIIESSIIEQKF